MGRSKSRKGGIGAKRGAAATGAAPQQMSAPPAHATGRNRLRIAVVVVVLAAIAATAYFTQISNRPTPAPAAAKPGTSPPIASADYVGATACKTCHDAEFNAWTTSQHKLAMQAATSSTVRGNFDGTKFTYGGVESTFFTRDGKYIVRTDGSDGKLADFEVKYTFGVDPLQQYLVEFPGGRFQALSIAWDTRRKEAGGQRWFHLYPGQKIKAGDPLHWTGLNQNWNFQCAECHSTNLRKNFDASTETFHTTWSEINVSCEACHGPGSNHLAWAQKSGDWQAMGASKGLVLALDERKGIAWTPIAETGNANRSRPRAEAREIETCARCHGRASRFSDDYVHGKPPLDTHRLALLDDDLYWNDGQIRDEVYNWGSFVQSRMYAQGVTCSDCHDPHSLKLRASGNAVCAQCHQPGTYDNAKHTHHKEGTTGAACAACHMPTTTYMLIDPRHDHSMRIPRPDVSAKIGSPNACNNCHTKQTARWAADTIREWTGKAPTSSQNFSEALRAGSIGAPGARAALLALIDDKAQPVIVRASAIQRLGHLLTPSTIDAVTRSLNDPDSVVRLAAVEAIANTEPDARQRYLPPMLDDPVRAVRIEAARALAGSAEQGLSEPQRASFTRALAEYVAAQTYNADRPEGRTALGSLYAQRGDATAISQYRKAIEMDPTFVPAYANLADLYRARGSDGEAVATLREGLARNPRGAVLYHALGLALVRQKQASEGLKELRKAVELAPENARFAYVYAVALHDAGQIKEAIQVLATALKREPYDRDVLSGLAYFTAQAGNRQQALGYVRQLRELDPENPQYAQLAKQIQSAP
jgi:predicted CXXCH cytochrome family protein